MRGGGKFLMASQNERRYETNERTNGICLISLHPRSSRLLKLMGFARARADFAEHDVRTWQIMAERKMQPRLRDCAGIFTQPSTCLFARLSRRKGECGVYLRWRAEPEKQRGRAIKISANFAHCACAAPQSSPHPPCSLPPSISGCQQANY